jgi:uncharacterized phage protein (TIGR02218 family)
MRNLSAGFATAVAKQAQTIGRLMAITMPDGSVKRFNSFGEPDFQWPASPALSWKGYPGFNISDVTFSDGSTAPTLEIERGLGLDSVLTFTEAASGLASGAPFELYLVDYVTLASHQIGSKWRVGQISTTREGVVNFDIVSLARRNKQLFLKRFGPGCKWNLGIDPDLGAGEGCQIDLFGSPSFSDTVTVITNADPWTLTVSGSSRADDYYNLGAMKFTAGNLNGQSFDVRDWTLSGGTIKLASPLSGPAAVSDTAIIHAGCDKSNGANGCARFNNHARRFSFDYLPDKNLTTIGIEPITTSTEPLFVVDL